MASTTPFPKTEWDTLHNNGPFPLKLLYVTELEGEANIPSKVDRYNDAAQEIQKLLQETLDNNEGFRAYGSRWSMSNIAHHAERMHYNGFMNIHLPIAEENLHENASYNSSNLFLFQCGNTIKRISEVLGAHGKSLKASGASNGQTIAGCVSTGVHGSALDVGAVQDYVVGINLITGPEINDIVYLERHTKPALSNTFIAQINARVIRNDKLFNAALVSLGSFGFVHGVVIEAEDRFLLKRYVRKIKKELALELAQTMDFKNSSFKIDEEFDENGKPKRPYHYKVFMNPYNNENQYVVELMYKHPYAVPYPDPFPIINKSVYRDLIHLFIKISEKFPDSIPWFIKRLKKVILPEVNEQTTGTLAEIFWDAPYQGPAFACSVGVDYKDSPKALDLLAKLAENEGPIPGIFAMRFVKKSEAILAFSKFPITCMIEIDGVLWKKSKKLMSLKQFTRRMIEVLKQNDVPFTIHWGKNSDWGFSGLVEHMYGENAQTWKNIRSAFLTEKMAKLFSNDFLDATGLSQLQQNVDEDLIASLT